MRWDPAFMEPAPDVADALRSAGLPVDKCERQTRPPHHVRTHYARRLTYQEQELATVIKHRVKQGLDPLPPPRKEKPKPSHREQLRATFDDRPTTEHAPASLSPRPTPARGRPGRTLQSRTVATPAEAAGMRLLGLEVIRQAFSDALNQKQNTQSIAPIEREQALSFLTAEHGAWAAARNMWCALADLNSDAIRDAAMRHIRDGTMIDFPSKCGPKFGPRSATGNS